jgi:hypothetical protein
MGAVTAAILDFNNADHLLEREELHALKRYPSQAALRRIQG